MIIRKASKADMDEVIGIATATVDYSYRDWLGNKVVNQYLETDKLSAYLLSHLSHMWLALDGSKIIGFAICIENMIDYILVGKDHQSQGNGATLLTHCEELLFEKYSTVSIESFEKNKVSTNFFNSKGWSYVNKYLDAKSQSVKLIFKKSIQDLTSENITLSAKSVC